MWHLKCIIQLVFSGSVAGSLVHFRDCKYVYLYIFDPIICDAFFIQWCTCRRTVKWKMFSSLMSRVFRESPNAFFACHVHHVEEHRLKKEAIVHTSHNKIKMTTFAFWRSTLQPYQLVRRQLNRSCKMWVGPTVFKLVSPIMTFRKCWHSEHGKTRASLDITICPFSCLALLSKITVCTEEKQ